MVTAQGLIGKFRQALDDKWGYIWGKYGQLWTEKDQENTTDEKARMYGTQWIGHRVADCSGLGYWAFRELGGFIVHGSNTIWNEYVTDRCELKNGQRTDGKPLFPGDPVFLKKTENGKISRHHIGYYVGDDTVIEAKGTQWGVVTSKLTRWHETAHWYNVQYDNGAYYSKLLTLKRGMSCDAVEELQALLNAKYGYNLEIDGLFGPETEAAVKDFQAKHNLTVDGIVGKKTWKTLDGKNEHSALSVKRKDDMGSQETNCGIGKQSQSEFPAPGVKLSRLDLFELKARLSDALFIVNNALEG